MVAVFFLQFGLVWFDDVIVFRPSYWKIDNFFTWVVPQWSCPLRRLITFLTLDVPLDQSNWSWPLWFYSERDPPSFLDYTFGRDPLILTLAVTLDVLLWSWPSIIPGLSLWSWPFNLYPGRDPRFFTLVVTLEHSGLYLWSWPLFFLLWTCPSIIPWLSLWSWPSISFLHYPFGRDPYVLTVNVTLHPSSISPLVMTL